MQASRDRVFSLQQNRSNGEHAGLILSRYLFHAVPANQASDADKKAHHEDKRKLFRDAASATVACGKCYQRAYKRWSDTFSKGSSLEIGTEGRLIVGLGGDNVLETGLTLHHTYGVPIIPGSALKGLAAHYCDQVWGARLENDPTKLTDDNHKYRRLRYGEKRGENGVHTDTGMHHEALFGTTEDSGHIIFHDAWITPDSLDTNGQSGLVLDVMTPHHGDYYSDRVYDGGSFQGQRIPPTDFDDPNPIAFLSVSGSFLIAVSCDVAHPESEAWSKLAFALLQEALREWGVGGKTSSGYGRLALVELSGKPGKIQTQVGRTKPNEPVHRIREKVKVIQRTIDGKLRYEADDGFLGSLLKGTPPSLKDGESTDLWIVRVDRQNMRVPYVFQSDEPLPLEAKSMQSKSQESVRNQKRPGGDRR